MCGCGTREHGLVINVAVLADLDKNLCKTNLSNSMTLRNAKTLDLGSSAVQAGNAKQLWHKRGQCSFEHRFFFLSLCAPSLALLQSALKISVPALLFFSNLKHFHP